MNGLIIGPFNGGKRRFLGSLSRSMALRNNSAEECIGTNTAMGDLNPPLMTWLQSGTLNFSPTPTTDVPYTLTIQASKESPSLTSQLQFWKNTNKTKVTCLGVNYIDASNILFDQKTADHLKKSEFLILCDSIQNITSDNSVHHRHHFENLAHLFLQMYSLDCVLKRIAFVITDGSMRTKEQEGASEVDLAISLFGTRVHEVFKTFCDDTVRFGFFLTEPLQVSSDERPLTLDQWTPHNTIDPMLFAVKGHTAPHELSLMELEVKCKA